MAGRGHPKAQDDCLYEPDAIMVGLLLFPPRVCSACEETLPGCSDYYQPDAHATDDLRTVCRRCRRKQRRDGERVRAQHRRDLAKVTP